MTDFSIDESVSGSLMSDVTINGLDDTKLTLAGGTTTTLAGENTVNTDSTITLEPVVSTATITLEPVTTTSTLDLKPVAVDTCLRLELAPVPPTELSVPYEQRWAFSLFGLEVLALGVRGRTSGEIRPAPRRPSVLGLADTGDHGDGCGCSGCAGQPSSDRDGSPKGCEYGCTRHGKQRDPIVIEL
jgi:hypothetical protein